MSDAGEEKDLKVAEVVEFGPKLKREKQTCVFYWVLDREINLFIGSANARLACVWENGPWKPGDCVKITMEKVG